MKFSALQKLSLEERILACILLWCFLFFPEAIGEFIIPLKRPILAGGIVWLITLSWRKKRLFLPTDIFSLLFAAFVVLHFLSMLWAFHPSLALYWGMHWLLLYALYVILRSLDLSTFQIRFWQRFIIGIIGLNFLVLTVFIAQQAFSTMDSFSLNAISYLDYKSFFHFSKNHFVSVFLMTLPILLSFHKNKQKGIIYTLPVLTCVLLLIIGSRLSTLVILSIGGYMAWTKIKLKQSSLFLYLGIALAIILFVFLFFAQGAQEGFFRRYDFLRSFEGTHSDVRLLLWKESFSLWLENPVLGIGSGNWHTQYLKSGAFADSPGRWSPNAHNLWIETAAELGITGLLLLVSLIFIPAIVLLKRSGIRSSQAILLTMHLAAAMIFTVYSIAYNPMVSFPFTQFMWISSIAILFNLYKIKKKWKSRRIVPLCIFSISLVVCIWTTFVSRQDYFYRQYEAHLRANQHAEALLALEKMYIPHLYEFHQKKDLRMLLGREYMANRQLDKAFRYLRSASETSPYRFTSWFYFGNYYKRKGQLRLAIGAFKRSIEFHSKHYQSYLMLAESALEVEDWQAFDQGMGGYYGSLLPMVENHYSPELMERGDEKILRFWEINLRLANQFKKLEAKKEQLLQP